MIPTAKGQIVRLHTPVEGEDPQQMYVVLEIYNGPELPRAQIQPLKTGLGFPPIGVVNPGELEVIAVPTVDLLSHTSSVRINGCMTVSGKIVAVEQSEVTADLTLTDMGVETNVKVMILDGKGEKHWGTLRVIE